jgi:hypothetical protein
MTPYFTMAGACIFNAKICYIVACAFKKSHFVKFRATEKRLACLKKASIKKLIGHFNGKMMIILLRKIIYIGRDRVGENLRVL